MQLGLQLLERAAQRAFAGFLQRIEDQLVVAARLVQRQPPAGQHPHAVARLEPQPLALGLEQRAAHLRARVLEREVDVPRRGPCQVADLALDQHHRERVLQQAARQRVELTGAEDVVGDRSEEHTSEIQSLMRISYAVFCLKKKKQNKCREKDAKRERWLTQSIVCTMNNLVYRHRYSQSNDRRVYNRDNKRVQRYIERNTAAE